MNERELDKLADLIVAKTGTHPPKCIVFTDDDIAGIKAFANAYNTGAKTFKSVVIGILTLGILITFIAGIIEYLKKYLPK